jgi:hypothetical protein
MDYFRVRRLAALAGARAAVHRTADEAAQFLDTTLLDISAIKRENLRPA